MNDVREKKRRKRMRGKKSISGREEAEGGAVGNRSKGRRREEGEGVGMSLRDEGQKIIKDYRERM